MADSDPGTTAPGARRVPHSARDATTKQSAPGWVCGRVAASSVGAGSRSCTATSIPWLWRAWARVRPPMPVPMDVTRMGVSLGGVRSVPVGRHTRFELLIQPTAREVLVEDLGEPLLVLVVAPVESVRGAEIQLQCAQHP